MKIDRLLPAWYRPIGLLGADEFSANQDTLTKTPTMRGKLALQIPDAVVAIYENWLHRGLKMKLKIPIFISETK